MVRSFSFVYPDVAIFFDHEFVFANKDATMLMICQVLRNTIVVVEVFSFFNEKVYLIWCRFLNSNHIWQVLQHHRNALNKKEFTLSLRTGQLCSNLSFFLSNRMFRLIIENFLMFSLSNLCFCFEGILRESFLLSTHLTLSWCCLSPNSRGAIK